MTLAITSVHSTETLAKPTKETMTATITIMPDSHWRPVCEGGGESIILLSVRTVHYTTTPRKHQIRIKSST